MIPKQLIFPHLNLFLKKASGNWDAATNYFNLLCNLIEVHAEV